MLSVLLDYLLFVRGMLMKQIDDAHLRVHVQFATNRLRLRSKFRIANGIGGHENLARLL